MEREEFILNIFIFIFAEDYKGEENRGLKFSQLQKVILNEGENFFLRTLHHTIKEIGVIKIAEP